MSKKLMSFVFCAFMISVLLVSLTGFAGVTPARAATLTVTDCSTPDQLVAVIAAASAGDTIVFACSGTIRLTATLVIDKNLTIDGTGQAVVISGDGLVRVFVVNTAVIAELRGLTIINGKTDLGGGIYNYGTLTLVDSTLSGNTAELSGGGIYNVGSLAISHSTLSNNRANPYDSGGGGIFNTGTLTITDSTLSGNSAVEGGGIYAYGSVEISNSTLSNNEAVDAGGGIYNVGSVEISHSTLSNNKVSRYGGYGGGGGILNRSTLTVVNSTLSNNHSAFYGGGIYNYTGAMTVENTTLSGNRAIDGGGIYNQSGRLTLTDSTLFGNFTNHNGSGIYNEIGALTVANSNVSGNYAAMYGGGIYNLSGSLTVENSTFSENSAAGDGGGIYNYYGVLAMVVNTTLSGNTSGNDGGGIYNDHVLTMVNSTLSGNTSGILGGGIYNQGDLDLRNNTLSGNAASHGGGLYNAYGGTLNYYNTIIANSSGGGDCELGGSISPRTNIHNLVEDGTCEASLWGDPLLGALADNGGPTWTFALLGESPALDAGDNATCATAPVSGLDQRGVARPFGAQCDIGAYEAMIQTGPSFVVNDKTDTDDEICELKPSGDCTLREALNAANAHAGADTINFDAALSGQTILLDATLTLASDVTIDGGGQRLTLSGQDTVGVLAVSSGVTAILQGLTIANGSAVDGGGISNAGVLTVIGSTISGSHASGAGGGIFNSGSLGVSNSTFSANSASSGGGIYNGNSLMVTNSTLSGNTGSGLYNANGSELNYSNTIIANSAGADCFNVGTLGTNTNNLVEDGTCEASLWGDPLLGALADNGGPTWTFALLEGSPALDAGHDATCAAVSISGLDQRGVARPFGAHCDIGAYESILQYGPSFVVNDSAGTDDGRCELKPSGNCTLYDALDAANAYPGANTISFEAALSGQTILLVSPLTLASDVTIDGGGQRITLSGQDTVGVLVVNSGVTAVLQGLTIANGNASNGGGIYNAGASLSVLNSTFSGNRGTRGGGIYNHTGASLSVTNCTFSDNSVWNYGGGIFNDGSLTLRNSTLSGGKALITGDGIFNDTHGTLNYANTIIANSLGEGYDCAIAGAGTIGTNTRNLVEDGTCSPALSGDPQLGVLADNGGPTWTFALLEGSPAVDAGDDPTCAAVPVSGLDQRGVERPYGAHCEIGAYEEALMQPGPSFVVNNSTDTDDGGCYLAPSGDCTLREALNAANAHAGADTIRFEAALSGQTILLGSPLTLASDVTVDGGGQRITISGQNAVRVLAVNSGVTAALRGLTIANGTEIKGGGIYNAGASLSVLNSTFSGNRGSLGGGIYNETGASLSVANSTFSDNSVWSYGGGIYNDGSLTLRNSTLSGNFGGVAIGGIFNGTHGTLNYANTIIANSSGSGDCANAGTIGTNLRNLVEDGTCSPALSGDPQLGALADNGGPTWTFALLEGSRALEAGDDATCAAAPVSSLDQRGVARPQGAHCDIGAYEETLVQTGPSFVVNNSTDTDDGVCYSAPSGDCTLREALNAANAHPGADTISFAAGLSGQTIPLGATLTIASDVTIDGEGYRITLSGQNTVSVLAVNSGVTAVLQGLTIVNGSAVNAGGIYNGGVLTVADSTLSGCSANWGGGGIYNDGSLTVVNSTLFGNTSGNMGGGIYNRGGLGVSNSTFSANSAPNGGGIFNENSLVVTNSSLAGNTASTGGGLYNASGATTVNNSLIVKGGSGANCYGAIGGANNLADDSACGAGFTNSATILLGALGNYGGSTQTIPLLPGSSAINAGNNATCTAADQRGVTRPQGGQCDIGAHEKFTVYYAKPTAISAANCSTWDQACPLKSALTYAFSGDELWVAAGTYTPGALRTDTFQLKTGVAVYGGFSGTETLRSERNPAANVTTLSGEIGSAGNSDNSYHVVTGAGGATLDGFTITAGNADGTAPAPYGGGVYNPPPGSSPALSNLTIYSNMAAVAGGGMYSYQSSPTLLNVTFRDNVSGWAGGGMHTTTGSPTLTNVTFSGNTAAVYGGGMFNQDGAPVLTNVTLSGNTAGTAGGGMYNWDSASNPQIRNTIVWGNSPSEQIVNNGSATTVSDSVVQGGYAGGSNIITADPRLDELADNGGWTPTFALLLGSSAIDAGNPATCAAAPLNNLDQRGQARNDYQCDIGAFELKYADSDTVSMAISASTPVTYTFGPTMVKIEVTSTDGCLTGLTVQRYNVNHPNATTALQTGHWWQITPTPATGCTFSVNLTLPTDFAPDANDKLCRWNPGSPGQWDCVMSSFTSSSITRNAVTGFSDWTVGDNAGPTAITLSRLVARSALRPVSVWAICGLLALVALAVAGLRKR